MDNVERDLGDAREQERIDGVLGRVEDSVRSRDGEDAGVQASYSILKGHQIIIEGARAETRESKRRNEANSVAAALEVGEAGKGRRARGRETVSDNSGPKWAK
jgi:hypothetical protein